MFHTSSDRRSRREAIAAIMAEHGVSETSAYAMHVRAAAGVDQAAGRVVPIPKQRVEQHPEPSEAPATGQSSLTA